MKIKKPCFQIDDCIKIGECTTCSFAPWNTCEFGQLHPFYPNWSKMTEQAAAGPCLWKLDPDGFWLTGCGKSFYFDDATKPGENDFKFCPFCGGKIGTEES